MSDNIGFKPEDIGVVVENSESHLLKILLSSTTLAISVLISIININSVFYYNSDRRISVVEAPIKYDNDGVVLLKYRSGWSKSEKTRHIKAFVRTYMRNQFPQSPERAESASKKMLNMSIDLAKKEAESRVGLASDFSKMIESGDKMTFYPDSMLDKVYITETTYGWIVRLDGSLIKAFQSKEVRTRPTLEYKIEEVDITYDNPWGLAVSSFEFVLPKENSKAE